MNKIFYLGRIAKIKDLETLDKALFNTNIKADAIGPIEKGYNPEFKNIEIKPPIYDLKKKIKQIDKYHIFILPSKREAMPQALLEAMARGKIVIASETDGAKEIIESGKNGFLFEIGNPFELRLLIFTVLNYSNEVIKEIEKEAIKTDRKFQINKLMEKWEKL